MAYIVIFRFWIGTKIDSLKRKKTKQYMGYTNGNVNKELPAYRQSLMKQLRHMAEGLQHCYHIKNPKH